MGSTPYGLGIDDALGFVWATDRNAKNLFQFNLSTGAQINKTNTGSPAEELVVDPGGNVWVTQPTANTVVKMSTSDAILGTYAVGTSPGGIAMAPSRGILVTNTGSNTVSLLAL
jgi:DNA-binding beta-propeller fold protein YncE